MNTEKGNDQLGANAVQEPMRSVHTSNFPGILEQIAASLVVSTYQAGRLVLLRPENGLLNTHFRVFEKPMGLAVEAERIAIGTEKQVWEFHNLPAVCHKLNQPSPPSASNDPESPTAVEPPKAEPAPNTAAQPNTSPKATHDACFLPRTMHWTGDIQIHEMAYIDDELIFVNTLFSCLAKRSQQYNFEPVWRPKFIDKFLPGDCCHLNGLAVRDGQIRYVTALGQTNEPNGWRANKKDGGLLIDVQSDEIIAHGLSMPHSPRWYEGRLWCLQSGTGSFGTVDLATGKYTSIVELPGFTRGLSFWGPLAFIGLSQVRESAVFGGIPIAEKSLEERVCGVWVVNIQTGEIVAFVKFEEAVQEIFAVEVLSGAMYPEMVIDDAKLLAGSFELSDEMLHDVPQELKH